MGCTERERESESQCARVIYCVPLFELRSTHRQLKRECKDRALKLRTYNKWCSVCYLHVQKHAGHVRNVFLPQLQRLLFVQVFQPRPLRRRRLLQRY